MEDGDGDGNEDDYGRLDLIGMSLSWHVLSLNGGARSG
jgi:hypothetical protein